MERFTEAIQTTMREMGTQFIKAIAELSQEELDDEVIDE